LFDVRRIFAHWKNYPPTRDLVAAAIGFKPKGSEPEKKYLTAEDMRRIMRTTGGKVPGTAMGR
jgi:hypothetical protein